MVSRYISKYTNLIVNHLAAKYIRFQQTADEMAQTKARFLDKYNIPGVIGIIDGTHVAISAVNHHVENAFVNRKGLHSINVQIVCDDRMLITNINARYPGSTHDSYIFLTSQLHAFLQNLYTQNPNVLTFLLGTFFECRFHFSAFEAINLFVFLR